jgi:hypothetical protein
MSVQRAAVLHSSCEGSLGPWYALWRISALGHLLHFCSAGVPVAFMLSSSGTEATVKFFLNWVKERNPEIKPAIIMTDCNQAQINTIKAVYSDSTIYLCWWHVLCAMRTHFCTEEFPKLWEHVREWVKTPDRSKFESWWDEMQTDPSAPQSFIDYLKVNWMTIMPMWSGSVRKNHTIFQEGDTNMLIES